MDRQKECCLWGHPGLYGAFWRAWDKGLGCTGMLGGWDFSVQGWIAYSRGCAERVQGCMAI